MAMMNMNRNPKKLHRFKKYVKRERGRTSTDPKGDKSTARLNEPNFSEQNGKGARPSQSKKPRLTNDMKGNKSSTE